MALFIDSSDPKEIKDLFAWGVLSGRHDEPAHHRQGGARRRPGRAHPRGARGELGRRVGRADDRDRERDARGVAAVPRVGSGAHHHQGAVQRDRPARASPAARRSGIKTNVTCLMAMNQAYLAALAGATYVSIFSGRVRDMGYDVRPVIAVDARHPRPRGPALEDHRRLDAPHDGRERGARVRRPRARP